MIEYSTAAEARRQLAKARAARGLDPKPTRVEVFERTLFLDYAGDPEDRQVVSACGLRPDTPPPTPG